jgi:hypothetical protein
MSATWLLTHHIDKHGLNYYRYHYYYYYYCHRGSGIYFHTSILVTFSLNYINQCSEWSNIYSACPARSASTRHNSVLTQTIITTPDYQLSLFAT